MTSNIDLTNQYHTSSKNAQNFTPAYLRVLNTLFRNNQRDFQAFCLDLLVSLRQFVARE